MSANTVLPCATQRSLEKVLCLHSTLPRNATRSRRSKRCCVYTVLPCATQRGQSKGAARLRRSKRCCVYTVLPCATQRSLEKVLCVHSTLQRNATRSRRSKRCCVYTHGSTQPGSKDTAGK